MKIKIFTIITTMSLFLSQNIYSTKNEINLTKHKKHLIIGAYSLLGAYFAKKTWESLFPFVSNIMLKKEMYKLFPKHFVKYPYYQITWSGMVYTTYIYNLAKLSLFSFLTYFSIKNIIQELKEEEKKKQEPITG